MNSLINPLSKNLINFFTRVFLPFGKMPKADGLISASAIVFLLAEYWRPLGVDKSIFWNLIFVSVICFGLLGVFSLFIKYYTRILRWCLDNKLLFLSVPTAIVIAGFFIMKNTGKEFMPSLNEGSFLLMPTSMPHSGVEENKRVLQQLDMAVAAIKSMMMVNMC